MDNRTKEYISDLSYDVLLEKVTSWMETHDDFFNYMVSDSLLKEPDFLSLMEEIYSRNASFNIRSRYEISTQWNSIYYSAIYPYVELLESYCTETVYDFVYATLTVLISKIDDEDFSGDDWYGTDFSNEIIQIMEACELAVQILVLRDDLTPVHLNELQHLINVIRENDKASNYISTPYESMLEFINFKIKYNPPKSRLFDFLIENGLNSQRWIVKKAAYLTEMGLCYEAHDLLKSNLRYDGIRDYLIEEAVKDGNLKEAYSLIDNAIYLIRRNEQDNSIAGGKEKRWIKKKLEIARNAGDKHLCISLLSEMFADLPTREIYDELKALIDPAEWKGRIRGLLKQGRYHSLSALGEFLIIEDEKEWILQLLSSESYITLEDVVKYYGVLRDVYDNEAREIANKAFREYAQSNFAIGKRNSRERYEKFCDSLLRYWEYGAKSDAIELADEFANEFRGRYNFVSALNAMRKKIRAAET